MGTHRTAWHLLAQTFLDERRPACVQLETEVSLSKQPLRADILLIRKNDGPVDDATAFLRLWQLMGPVALVEYKSRGRPPRLGAFHQLFGYGHQYAHGRQRKTPASSLSLFLMVPELTPSLHKDAELLGLEFGSGEGAYIPVRGHVFPTWIVTLNALAEEEGEPLIGQLGSLTLAKEDRASWQWMAHFVMENKDRARNLEGFEDLRAKFLREMLPEMPADEVAEILTPEQRYGVFLAMSNDVLRQLPDAFVDSLPASVRAEIRRRLAH